MLIRESHQLPSSAAEIAAVFWRGEHAEQSQRARRLEERRVIHGFEEPDLRIGAAFGERSGRIRTAIRRLESLQSGAKIRRHCGKKRGERPVDEIDGVRL